MPKNFSGVNTSSYVNKRRDVGGRGRIVADNMAEVEAIVGLELYELLDGYLAEASKDVIQDVLYEDVYAKHVPLYERNGYASFYGHGSYIFRRYEAGGMADTGNMQVTTWGSGNEWGMSIRDNAKWQHFNRRAGGRKLDDAIEQGVSMHSAGARPFYEHADHEIEKLVQKEVADLCASL